MSKLFCHGLFRRAFWAAGIQVTLLSSSVLAQESAVISATPKFLGASSCATAMCHGGGGNNQNQSLIWSLKDVHSQRPFATLTTARSRQISKELNISDPTADARCTACHAPLQQVPIALRGEGLKISEGVSCESCHGPSENWIRSHTRKDFSHADKVAGGMRDLNNLYVRANTCVACHQNVDADILKAGHPELIFELDGQSVAEPKHWREATNWNGAQAWLVGQAVALREMSWQLTQMHGMTELSQRMSETNLTDRIMALSWVLRKVTDEQQGVQRFPEDFESSRSWSDKLARVTAVTPWSAQTTHEGLTRLGNLAPGFSEGLLRQSLQARRAERLVLALDRLVTALPDLKKNEPTQAALNKLFKLAQSLPDFDPVKFADALKEFEASLVARASRP